MYPQVAYEQKNEIVADHRLFTGYFVSWRRMALHSTQMLTL